MTLESALRKKHARPLLESIEVAIASAANAGRENCLADFIQQLLDTQDVKCRIP